MRTNREQNLPLSLMKSLRLIPLAPKLMLMRLKLLKLLPLKQKLLKQKLLSLMIHLMRLK